MAFSNEEIDTEFNEETNNLPATARRIRMKSWHTDVTRGDDGTPIGIIGPGQSRRRIDFFVYLGQPSIFTGPSSPRK